MKKVVVILMIFLLSASFGGYAFTAGAVDKPWLTEAEMLLSQEPGYDYILATPRGVWVLRGEVYQLPGYQRGLTDIVDGIAKVPVRAVAEFLGYAVDWNQETRQVTMTVATYDDIFVKKTTLIIEKPFIVEGRTMVPISCLYMLSWDHGQIVLVIAEEYALFRVRVKG